MKLFGFEIRRAPRVAPRAAEEVWVTAKGDCLKIGEMDEAHAKHSLAMIVRNVRAGAPVRMLSNGQIFFGDDTALEKREDFLFLTSELLFDPLGQESI